MAKIQPQSVGLEPELPRHIGIIMGRQRPLRHAAGPAEKARPRAGMERLRGLIRFSSDIGIEVLSLYAFSTENWKRPKEEIGALFDLFLEYFISELDELDKNNVCIRIMGDMSAFPEKMGQEDGRGHVQNQKQYRLEAQYCIELRQQGRGGTRLQCPY